MTSDDAASPPLHRLVAPGGRPRRRHQDQCPQEAAVRLPRRRPPARRHGGAEPRRHRAHGRSRHRAQPGPAEGRHGAADALPDHRPEPLPDDGAAHPGSGVAAQDRRGQGQVRRALARDHAREPGRGELPPGGETKEPGLRGGEPHRHGGVQPLRSDPSRRGRERTTPRAGHRAAPVGGAPRRPTGSRIPSRKNSSRAPTPRCNRPRRTSTPTGHCSSGA